MKHYSNTLLIRCSVFLLYGQQIPFSGKGMDCGLETAWRSKGRLKRGSEHERGALEMAVEESRGSEEALLGPDLLDGEHLLAADVRSEE